MKIKIDNFDLSQIADSGQCFRWKRLNDNSYLIPAFGKNLVISQNGNEFDFSCSKKEFDLLWKNYFDINRDYSDIGKRIFSTNDNHLKDAFNLGSGIRILNQDLWEIIFSFMISQNNNIKRISKSIEMICERVHLSSDNYESDFFSEVKDICRFPFASEIPLDIFDDSSLGLGYRAPYLKEICQFVIDNPLWLDELKKMNFDDAFKSLISRKGIGPKVANCICLFGLGHVEAFPIDTHVKQFLEKYYSDGIDLSLYPNEAGIIQQYLFYYELVNK